MAKKNKIPLSDLVAPANEVVRVINAVAKGDLSQKMSLEIEGRPVCDEFLRIGTTVNSMIDQLNSFAAEVTRVAKEVGNEGKLGGQADVKGVSGTWKDLTDNVNQLARNFTSQVRAIADVSTAVTKGDLTRLIHVEAQGDLFQELKRSNAELEAQVSELNQKAKLLEAKNREVELASKSVEEKAEQLQLISKYKSEFLANMSHELRTPLSSLLILSKVLSENKDGNLTLEQVRFANTVFTSGNDLLGLINEILDLSKVESGKMPINPKEIQLPSVQDYIEQIFRHIAEQKSIKFEIRIDEKLPQTMVTDAHRLYQILTNLISNAFKFTEQGSVELVIHPVDKFKKFSSANLPLNLNLIAFAVKDTGIGISADKQSLIFEAFQQVDGNTSLKYAGTGLGLTISREIAGLLGGWIEVQSAPCAGSVFILYLPQDYTRVEVTSSGQKTHLVSDAESNLTIPRLPDDADFTGKKILIMDDDIRNIFAINSVLESRKMKVFHAENGKLGILLLNQNPDVNLILMDTRMPEMDGLTATQEIRKVPKFKNLPIISLTAKAMKGDREKAIHAGASDYVTKPVDPEKLLSVMHIWLKNPRKTA